MRRDAVALAGQSFDVAVVGGGMHGAWIAWRAARAGLAVCLLERDEFGAGTSANSLKILHGGLRYLQQLDLARMRRSIAARREYARCFPHLFQPLPCVMPLGATGRRSPWLVGPALLASELLALDRNGGVDAPARLPAARLLSAQQCMQQMGSLASRSPFAGALWWDGLAADTTQLVAEVVGAAAAAGAQVARRVQVERILHTGGRVTGLAFTDRDTGQQHQLAARRVVNATGPWAAGLALRSGLPVEALPAAWTGAMNLVLRRSLGNGAAVALSMATRRGARELFFVPWNGRTMIGTGYCPVDSIEAGLAGPPAEAVAAFTRQAAALAPAARIESADIASVHWGLMPLARPGDTLPCRSALLLTDARDTGATGLVTLIGEKLTSAPEVSARVLARLGLS